MSTINLRVNGKTHTLDLDPGTPLLYVLRNDLDLHGPRFGCGLGQCGACTVLIRGEAVRSCMRPVSSWRSASAFQWAPDTGDALIHLGTTIRCS